MVNLNLEIPDDLHKTIKLYAVKHNATLKDVIITILEKRAKQK